MASRNLDENKPTLSGASPGQTLPPSHPLRARLKRAGITCVGFNLRKASRMVTRYMDEVLEPTGLRSTQFSLLAAIGRHQKMSHSHLARLLVMDRTTLTRSLKPLEKMGWIEHARSPDRRKRLVMLTPAGWQVLEQAIPLWESAQQELLDEMGEDNASQLLKFIWRYVYGKRYLDA